jgi:hypothetical protein
VLGGALLVLTGCSGSKPAQTSFQFERAPGQGGSLPKDRRAASGNEPTLPPITGIPAGPGQEKKDRK